MGQTGRRCFHCWGVCVAGCHHHNTKAVYKDVSRLQFLRKLRSSNVCSKMLEIFFQSVVARALFFAVVCWGNIIGTSDSNWFRRTTLSLAADYSGCVYYGGKEKVTKNTVYPSWIMPTSLSNTSWTDSKSPSPTDRCSSAVTSKGIQEVITALIAH